MANNPAEGFGLQKHPNTSAGYPTIFFVGDEGTGIGSAAAGEVGVYSAYTKVKAFQYGATATLETLSGAATTTGIGLSLASFDVLTTGQALKIASSATAITTTGRLFLSSHTGASGTSATLNEFKSAAADETVICQVTASAALALGKALNVSVAALTTGTAIDCSDNTALTTGILLNLNSNSSDTTARFLAHIKNQHASAIGVVPLKITNAAVTGTGSKFASMIRCTEGTKVTTIWLSIDATTPNGNLTGVVGDICLNGPSGRSFYCTGTTNWTASNA